MTRKKRSSGKITDMHRSDKRNDGKAIEKSPDDGIPLSKFSISAKDLLWQYSSQIRDTFADAGLMADEVEDAANDIVDHVIRLSILNAGADQMVLTDHVNRAINKLGDASTIGSIIDSDQNLDAEISHTIPRKKSFSLTAQHLAGLYWLLSWLLTGSLIFMIFGYKDFRWVGSILFVITIFLLLLVKSTGSYQRNRYIRSVYRVNPHILLFPFAFELISILYLSTRPIIMDPIIITAWLMILTTEEVRNLVKSVLGSTQQYLKKGI